MYPCACCGFLASGYPGDYGTCPICLWEDDGVQLHQPLYAGGANTVSLYEAQQNFLRCGACEARFVGHPPGPDDERDPYWRPFDPQRDTQPPFDMDDDLRQRYQAACDNPISLYYWRPEYWFANQGAKAKKTLD